MTNLKNSQSLKRAGDNLTTGRAELLFAAVIIARSSSFMVSKVGLATMETFTLLAVRFLLAFIILAVIFHRRLLQMNRETLFLGIRMGALLFLVMTAELLGLKTTSASATSLLENLAIVFVPLFEAVLHKHLPRAVSVGCAVIAFAGVALLTLKDGGFALSGGELLCLLAAVLYSASVIQMDRFSRRQDPLVLGILQIGFLGLFALIGSFIFETPALPGTVTDWGIVIYLALICTCFGFTFQPVAQSKMTSERAGLLSSLNPASAAVLSMIFLGERFGAMGLCGAALILIAIAVPSVLKNLKKE